MLRPTLMRMDDGNAIPYYEFNVLLPSLVACLLGRAMIVSTLDVSPCSNSCIPSAAQILAQGQTAPAPASACSPQLAMVKGFKHMDARERDLIISMRKEGLTWSAIQRITGSSPSTLSTALTTKEVTKKQPKAAPKQLTEKAMNGRLRMIATLQKRAQGRIEVTLPMITKAAGVTVCAKTVQRRLLSLGISFRKLKDGPNATVSRLSEVRVHRVGERVQNFAEEVLLRHARPRDELLACL